MKYQRATAKAPRRDAKDVRLDSHRTARPSLKGECSGAGSNSIPGMLSAYFTFPKDLLTRSLRLEKMLGGIHGPRPAAYGGRRRPALRRVEEVVMTGNR